MPGRAEVSQIIGDVAGFSGLATSSGLGNTLQLTKVEAVAKSTSSGRFPPSGFIISDATTLIYVKNLLARGCSPAALL